MAKVSEVYELLNSLSPFDLQESWDNSGLNLGRLDEEFLQIYACLELTEKIAQEIPEKSLVISHHPLLFRPIKNFVYDAYPANIAKILIQKNASLICMHTNFDTTHLNAYFAKDILGLSHLLPEGIALSGKIDPINFADLLKIIKEKLKAKYIAYVQASLNVGFVSVVCGAGASYLYQSCLKPNSCLITGDIKYHDAMIAKSLKINLIDVGHYPSERFFPEIIESILKSKGYQVIIKDSKNPFEYL